MRLLPSFLEETQRLFARWRRGCPMLRCKPLQRRTTWRRPPFMSRVATVTTSAGLPCCEVALCGSYARNGIRNHERAGWTKKRVVFDTRSGELSVQRSGRLLSMDFPSLPPSPAEPPPGLLEGLGGEPLEVLKANYYLVVYSSEAEIRELKPNFSVLGAIDRLAVIVAAHGDEVDFVSRFFAPGYGLLEDPVTGSAHCTLVPVLCPASLQECVPRAPTLTKRRRAVLRGCRKPGDHCRQCGSLPARNHRNNRT